MNITLENLEELDAEGIAESIVADFLEVNIDRDEIPINGVVRRGYLSESEMPNRPRVTVSVIDDSSEFIHVKLARVSLLVSVETFALGNGPQLDYATQHAGTPGEVSARWRADIRAMLQDADLWTTYLTAIRDFLDANPPAVISWSPAKYHLREGGVDEDETTRERDLATVFEMTLLRSDAS